MRAIEISEFGEPDVLKIVERPTPVPGAGELRIRVAAAGVNHPDIHQRRGRYPPPPGASDLPGLEVSGVVDAIGADVTGWRVGDSVCALLTGGGYAEYCVAPALQCLPIPQGCSLIDAAGLPETTFTVWANLVERGHLRKGDVVLVHGGSSGIGTTAIQLAKAYGACVFVTAGTKEKCAACLALGADVAINYRESDFVTAVKAATGDAGVSLILDMIGGDYLARNTEALATDGRLVMIGRQGGTRAELDVMAVLRKRLTITGSTLRTRTIAEKGAIAEAVRAHVWPLFAAGAMKVVVHQAFPFERAADAHRVMEASVHVGKLLLLVES